MPLQHIKAAIAILDAAGYQRAPTGCGTYDNEERPMYHDGTYVADLVVYEDPTRPVIDRLHARLTPDAPLRLAVPRDQP
jgi:hypothetical protein